MKDLKLQEKPTALNRKHPALQNDMLHTLFTFFIFCVSILLTWIPIRGQPDQNTFGSGSGSRTPDPSVTKLPDQNTNG
jgi:hypothetical protein